MPLRAAVLLPLCRALLGGDMQLFNAKDCSNWLRVFVMILYDLP
jgi:hypothetical protein